MTTKHARIQTAHRANAEAGVSLRQRRTWHAQEPDYSRYAQAKPASTPGEKPHDKTRAEYVARPADEAYADAERLAQDKRYADAHKRSEIGKLFQEATAEVTSRRDETLASLEKERAETERKARGDFLPDTDTLLQMNYVRQWLESQHAIRDGLQRVRERWELAIKDGDKVTARAIRDFLPGVFGNQHAEALALHSALAKQADDLLTTPEQRKALEKLDYLKETTLRVTMSAGRSLARLKTGFRLENGKVVEAGIANLRDANRRGW